MGKLLKIHGALFIVNLIYAGNYSIAKALMPTYISPFGFILLRVSTACILYWLVNKLFVTEKVKKKDIPLLILCGFFGVATNQMLFFKGLSLTVPINAALIMVTTPILVLVVSAILLKEKITLVKSIGIILGAAGATLLVLYGQLEDLSGVGWKGDILVFLNATSYGIYLVIVKPLMKKYNPITVITYVFTFGLIFVIPFGWEEYLSVDWMNLPLNAIMGMIYVVIGTTFIAYLLNIYALKAVNPSVVGIYIYLQPLLASIIAISFGQDQLTMIKIISMIIIFIGVYMVSFMKQPSK